MYGLFYPKLNGETLVKNREEAACILCDVVTMISCLALPIVIISITASAGV